MSRLTVAQLVDACRPPDPETASLWRRRTRMFCQKGALPMYPRRRRAYREFSANTVPLAALLLRLPDCGYPLDSVLTVARRITHPRRTEADKQFQRFWHDAKATNGADAYLALSSRRDDPASVQFRCARGPVAIDDGNVWAVVNLSELFRELELASVALNDDGKTDARANRVQSRRRTPMNA